MPLILPGVIHRSHGTGISIQWELGWGLWVRRKWFFFWNISLFHFTFGSEVTLFVQWSCWRDKMRFVFQCPLKSAKDQFLILRSHANRKCAFCKAHFKNGSSHWNACPSQWICQSSWWPRAWTWSISPNIHFFRHEKRSYIIVIDL